MRMYVDKRLDGVQAVQTLSRLNRMIPGKDAPVRPRLRQRGRGHLPGLQALLRRDRACRRPPTRRKLETLKHELDQAQVYHWSEVEAFAQVFYKPVGAAERRPTTRRCSGTCSRPWTASRRSRTRTKRQEFREKLSGYVHVYAFLSQIIPYADPELEMLYSYGRFLLPHLPLDRDTTVVKLGDEVGLQYYRLERVFSGAIEVKEGEARVREEPDRCRHRQGEGREGAAVGDHPGAERALRHAVHRGGPALLPADQGEGVPATSRSSRPRSPTRSTSSSWASAS